jgi:cysteine-rich repeat protein
VAAIATGIDMNKDTKPDITFKDGSNTVDNHTIYLGDGNDIYSALGYTTKGATALKVYGGKGNDTLNQGDGTANVKEILSGGEGTDILSYASRTVGVTITVGNGANDGEAGENDQVESDIETITGTGVVDTISIHSSVSGSLGFTINGGDGADVLTGGAGADTINGGAGNDVILGGAGNDTLNGDAGNDTIRGGAGNDTLNGGDGDDTFDEDGDATLGLGADIFNGGAGTDTIDYSAREVDLQVSLDGSANDGAEGETDNVKNDVENVIGGSGDDTIVGSAANNRLTGGPGADTLTGGAGDDVFLEGASPNGADTFIGGAGVDTIDYSSRTLPVQVTLGLGVGTTTAEKNAPASDDGFFVSFAYDSAIVPVCGNAVVELGEGCDDGNADGGDGCSAACVVETGFFCTHGGVACEVGDDADKTCGDGMVHIGEECDDGNTDASDGCAADCTWETPADDFTLYYYVTADADVGVIDYDAGTCGDSIVQNGEACDDGGTAGGDGCAADCSAVEVGYYCDTAGEACVDEDDAATCGDGTLDKYEACDDGNEVDGDGCTDCAVDSGWRCVGGTVCNNADDPTCGNGTVADDEECDDGNTTAGDGCSATCTREDAVCGDDLVNIGEECDDGNTSAGDGCAADCTFEAGPWSYLVAGVVVTLNDPDTAGVSEGDTANFEIENILGGTAADILIGNSLANEISGGAGADTIEGGAGDDTIEGGAGADDIDCGAGEGDINFSPSGDSSSVSCEF